MTRFDIRRSLLPLAAMAFWLAIPLAGSYAQDSAAEPAAELAAKPATQASAEVRTPGSWWQRPAIVEGLGLSDAQRAALDQALAGHSDEMMTLLRLRREAERAMQEAFVAGEPGALGAAEEALNAASANVVAKQVAYFEALAAELDAEQRRQLVDQFAQALRPRRSARSPEAGGPRANRTPWRSDGH